MEYTGSNGNDGVDATGRYSFSIALRGTRGSVHHQKPQNEYQDAEDALGWLGP